MLLTRLSGLPSYPTIKEEVIGMACSRGWRLERKLRYSLSQMMGTRKPEGGRFKYEPVFHLREGTLNPGAETGKEGPAPDMNQQTNVRKTARFRVFQIRRLSRPYLEELYMKSPMKVINSSSGQMRSEEHTSEL